MPEPVHDELAQALRELAGRFGDTAFTDRRRLVSLLSDRLPDARRDIKVVSAAVDERIFDALARARPEQLALEIERLAAKLENGLGIRPEIAVPVVQACAYGLSLGPLPSQVGGAPAPALPPAVTRPPAATPLPQSIPSRDDGWIGVSEPVQGAAQAARTDQRSGPGSAARPGILANRWLIPAALVVVAAVAGSLYFVLRPAPTPPTPQPTPVVKPEPVKPDPVKPAQQPVPPPVQPAVQPAVPQTPPPPAVEDEFTDFKVPPQDTLKQTGTRDPTPRTIPVPGVVTTYTTVLDDQMHRNSLFLLVDVTKEPHEKTLPGAVYLPNAGNPGTFGDQPQVQFITALARLTYDKDETIVFFCHGIRCWDSYNAALRAQFAGYTSVVWYRGGLAAWSAARLPMVSTPPPQ